MFVTRVVSVCGTLDIELLWIVPRIHLVYWLFCSVLIIWLWRYLFGPQKCL